MGMDRLEMSLEQMRHDLRREPPPSFPFPGNYALLIADNTNNAKE
jgi:hypothetical protein